MKARYLYFRIFLCVLIGMIPLPGVERKFYDLLVKFSHEEKMEKSLAILEFDRGAMLDSHTRVLNQNVKLQDSMIRPSDFPAWDDLIFAQLIERLKKASPKLLIVTYPFPSTIDDSRTRMTFESIQGVPIVWASRLLQEGGIEYPPSALTPYTNYGYSDFFLDPDGILRQIQLFRSGHVMLELRALRELGGSIDSLDLDQPQFLRYYTSVRDLPRLTLPQILFQPVDTWEKWVKNKVVYIGVITPDLSTIKTPKGVFTRSEMHAMTLLNLMNEQGFVVELDEWAQILISLLVIALTIWITFKTSVSWAAALVLMLGGVMFGISFLMLDIAHVWIHLASPLFGIIMTYALLAHYQLITQEEGKALAEQEAENLRKVDEMKSNYMSLFSHDLKTPIAKINAICDRMLQTQEGKGLKPKFTKEFKAVSAYSQELQNYIVNILNLTKVESGQVQIQKSVCDLNVIIKDSIAQIQPLTELKKIQISTNLEPLYTIELDEGLIREILQNVLENAIQYSPANALVDVKSREEDKEVVIEICDNGPGIGKEDIGHVTEKFFRGTGSEKNTKGSGLGLYLVKYFTEIQGGRFQIASQQGQGTKVEIRFPVE